MLDCVTGLDTHCQELQEYPLTLNSKLTCKLCRRRFPTPSVGPMCFWRSGPKSDFLLRRRYTSDVICVAGPALAESLAA